MSGRSGARFANGVVVAFAMAFFVVHGVLGAVFVMGAISGSLAWLAWAGVGLLAAHVALSVVTSKQQLSDKQRPPSPRKKRHLALKWATGAVIAVAVAVHVALVQTAGDSAPFSYPPTLFVLLFLAVAVAVHVWVGSKSILVDLGIDKRHQSTVRVAGCTAALIIAAITIAAFVLR